MGPVASSADDVVVDDVVAETEGLWSRGELFNGGGQDGVHVDLRIHPSNSNNIHMLTVLTTPVPYLRKWRKIVLNLSNRAAAPETVEPIVEVFLGTVAVCGMDGRFYGHWAGTHVPPGRVHHLDHEHGHSAVGFVSDRQDAIRSTLIRPNKMQEQFLANALSAVPDNEASVADSRSEHLVVQGDVPLGLIAAHLAGDLDSDVALLDFIPVDTSNIKIVDRQISDMNDDFPPYLVPFSLRRWM